MRNLSALTIVSIITLTMLPMANAQRISFALSDSVGMSISALDAATQRLQQHIDAGDIAVVVAAVTRDG